MTLTTHPGLIDGRLRRSRAGLRLQPETPPAGLAIELRSSRGLPTDRLLIGFLLPLGLRPRPASAHPAHSMPIGIVIAVRV